MRETDIPAVFDKLRVLYAEDSKDDYLMVRGILSELVDDLYIEHATTFDEARDSLKDRSFDLLLVDYVLSHMTTADSAGISVAEYCIESGLSIPIAMISGMEEFTLSYRMLEQVASGNMGFIYKNTLDKERMRRTLVRLLQPRYRMLLVNGSEEECELFAELLAKCRLVRLSLQVASDLDAATVLLDQQSFDVVFVDHNQPMEEVSAFFCHLSALQKTTGMVLLTGFRRVDLPTPLAQLIEEQQLLLQPKASLTEYRLTEDILYFSSGARAERGAVGHTDPQVAPARGQG